MGEKIINEDTSILYVGLGKRIITHIIDIIVHIPIVFVYQFALRYSLENRSVIPITIYYLILNIYIIFMVVRFGGTPGKLLLKTRIINKNCEKLSILQALLRTLTYVPSYVAFIISIHILINQINIDGLQGNEIMNFYRDHKATNTFEIIGSILVGIDVIIILFNKKKRAIHDYLAGSYVVYKQ